MRKWPSLAGGLHPFGTDVFATTYDVQVGRSFEIFSSSYFLFTMSCFLLYQRSRISVVDSLSSHNQDGRGAIQIYIIVAPLVKEDSRRSLRHKIRPLKPIQIRETPIVLARVAPCPPHVVNTQSNNRRGDGGIEAPTPQGAWASHLEGEEDVDDGNDNEEHVKIEETVDEECLSDDDMPRGHTFRFTPSGEAALAVDKAAGSGAHTGGHAKGVGLRRRGEGARWDSAALGLGHRGLPKRYSGGNTGARDSHVWTPLTNPAEMEFYRFAVASDPGKNILRLIYGSQYRWQGNKNVGLFPRKHCVLPQTKQHRKNDPLRSGPQIGPRRRNLPGARAWICCGSGSRPDSLVLAGMTY